jgi:acetyltransferase-like isoleucine patch superfamily enzyme
MDGDLSSDDRRISIGSGTYASSPPLLRAHHANNRIVIGNFCSIAHDVTIFAGGDHPQDYMTLNPLKLRLRIYEFDGWSRDCGDDHDVTTIGNDVWLGHQALVLSGVTIGDGAIVGARAVVAKDVPPYAIVVGNPAKIIKYRFDQRSIDALLRLKWWDWSEDHIRAAVDHLCARDMARLFDYAADHGLTSPDEPPVHGDGAPSADGPLRTMALSRWLHTLFTRK